MMVFGMSFPILSRNFASRMITLSLGLKLTLYFLFSPSPILTKIGCLRYPIASDTFFSFQTRKRSASWTSVNILAIRTYYFADSTPSGYSTRISGLVLNLSIGVFILVIILLAQAILPEFGGIFFGIGGLARLSLNRDSIWSSSF